MVLDNSNKVDSKPLRNCTCSAHTKSKAISNPIKHKQIKKTNNKGIALKCDIHNKE